MQVFRGAKEDERGLELQVCRRGVWASAGQRSAAASLDRAHLQCPSRHRPGDSLLTGKIIRESLLLAWGSISALSPFAPTSTPDYKLLMHERRSSVRDLGK